MAARLSLLVACLGALGPVAARADQQCIPGTVICAQVGPGGKVTVAPPPVVIQPPPVQVQPPAVGVDPQLPPAQVDLQAQLRARWQAYFDWEARLRVDAEAKVRAEVLTELVDQERAAPDPSFGVAPPVTFYRPPPPMDFPSLELGVLGLRLGVLSGPGNPSFLGYSIDLRYRFDRDWGVSLDPEVLYQEHDALRYLAWGLRPGVFYSFAEGRGSLTGSYAAALAGLDVSFPTGGAATPTSLLGAHAGLSVRAALDHFRWGADIEGLVRAGAGGGSDPGVADIRRTRLGMSVRFVVVGLGF